MVVERDPGEWYLGGTMAAFTGPAPFGWVQRIDPVSLEPLLSSPNLPYGEHVWCGAHPHDPSERALSDITW